MDGKKTLTHTKRDQEVKDGELLAAASLMTADRTKDLAGASTLLAKTTQESANLLAKTTQESADLLAKTTQASADQLSKSNEVSASLLKKTTQESADLLAKTTQESADQLRKSNEISVRRMEFLTIAVIAVGLIPAVIAVAELFMDPR